jgi:hypothetical protein
MRKLIFVLFIFGCSYKQSVITTEEDGCEYFVVKTNGVVTAMTHKGNCSNPIHQYIDTTDLVEQSPNFKVYVRRSDKNTRVDIPNMGAAPITIHSSK